MKNSVCLDLADNKSVFQFVIPIQEGYPEMLRSLPVGRQAQRDKTNKVTTQ